MLFFSQHLFHTFCHGSGMRIICTQLKINLNEMFQNTGIETEKQGNLFFFFELHLGYDSYYFLRKITNKMLNSENNDKQMRSINQVCIKILLCRRFHGCGTLKSWR